MKFYRYPLALVGFALIFIFLFALGWTSIQKNNTGLSVFWYYMLAIAGTYVLVSLLLSKLKIHWEIDVLIQVALVLAPILWYVNQHDPYKRPVYIFVTNPVYSGKLDIVFAKNKDGRTNAHNPADTLYFKFDEDGKIVLNEEADYVRYSMHNNLFMIDGDGNRTHISFAKHDSLPTDNTKKVLIEYAADAQKGK